MICACKGHQQNKTKVVKTKAVSQQRCDWRCPIPFTIDNDGDMEYEVHKKKWTFSGVAGVIVYQWKESGKMYYLAVMFRKPTVVRNMWPMGCCDIWEQTRGKWATVTIQCAEKSDGRVSTHERRFELYGQGGWSIHSARGHMHVYNWKFCSHYSLMHSWPWQITTVVHDHAVRIIRITNLDYYRYKHK